MQKIADAEKAGLKIEPWDYRYYAEKVRKAKYDLDQNEVKPYLQLDKMREAMFWAASQLYGLDVQAGQGRAGLSPRRHGLRGHARRQARRASGTSIPTRATASARGAWMNEYRTQEAFKSPRHADRLEQLELREGQGRRAGADLVGRRDDHVPRVRPRAARPQLERPLPDARRHEHACATSSSSRASSTSTGSPTPEVLNKFALHYQTGKPIPAELVAKIEKAKNFNQGFKTVEYLLSAIYDLKIHTAPTDKPIDPASSRRRR